MRGRVTILIRSDAVYIVDAPKGLLFVVVGEGGRGRVLAVSNPTLANPIALRPGQQP